MKMIAPAVVFGILIASGVSAAQPKSTSQVGAVPVTPSARESIAQNPIARLSLGDLSVTRERPLFAASRRPAHPPQRIVQQQESKLVLLGVIASGPNSIAIVRDDDSKAVLRLRLGESISGAQLVEVAGRRATFASAGRELVLEIQPSQ